MGVHIDLGNRRGPRPKSKVGGKVFGTLFGGVFFAVGVGALIFILMDLSVWIQAKTWEPVQANLLRAELESNYSDGSTTYKATAEYSYYFEGGEYKNDRVAISDGGDNVGSFQEDLGRWLESAYRSNRSITVYVSPSNPSNSIINREMRWGMIGFKAIFLILFGAVGGGVLYGTWVYKSTPKDPDNPKYKDKPWMMNNKWHGDDIKSNAKLGMYFIWGFAIFWSLISSFIPFVVYEEFTEKGNNAALIGLLFPLIGLFLIATAIRTTMRWKRFGASPLKLDPFPGSIGGHVGGTIEINHPYNSTDKFIMVLTNLHSYISGSGKNRSRRESAKWQKKVLAYSEPGLYGTRLTIRFDVPDNDSESDADPDTSSYYLWRLNVSSELSGVDFDRDYEIPVYKTSEQSVSISDRILEEVESNTKELHGSKIKEIIQLRHGVNGPELFYPVGHGAKTGVPFMLIGAIFFAVSIGMSFADDVPIFFLGIFGLVGIALFCGGMYSIFNSLQVMFDGLYLKTIRRLFGFVISNKEILKDSIVSIDKKRGGGASSGNKHTVFYSIFVKNSSGEKIVVGEGFEGDGQTDEAILFLSKELGLRL